MLDMREYAQRVVDLTVGHTKEDITEERDWPLRLSLERALEIIGEAGKSSTEGCSSSVPADPLGGDHRMRNLIHGSTPSTSCNSGMRLP